MNTEAIIDFLDQKFNKEANILLFGSYTKSENYSDIDVLIISEIFTVFSKEKFKYKNENIEVFIFPKNNFYELIEKDKTYGIYISIIKEGIIVKDTDRFIEKIKKLIDFNKIKKSPFLKTRYLEDRIQSSIQTLRKTDDCNLKELVFGELNIFLIELRVLQMGVSEVKKIKKSYDFIKENDHQFVENLFFYKRKFIQTKNFNDYIKELSNYFSIHNILSKESYSTNYYINEIYSDELVIYINLTKNDLSKLKTGLIKEFSTIEFDDFYFFTIQKGKILENGTYLVLIEEKERIKTVLIPLLNKFHNSNITFPYQIEIPSILGIYEKKNCSVINSLFIYLEKNKNRINSALIFINIYIGAYLLLKASRESILKKTNLILLKYENIIKHEDLNISLFQLEIFQKHNESFFKNNINTDLIECYENAVNNSNIDYLPNHSVNSVIKNIDTEFLFGESPNVEYNFFNMILNVFSYNDFQKLYIFHTIAKIIKS